VDQLASRVVADFGSEWEAFDQSHLSQEERSRIFAAYFAPFPLEEMAGKEGFDLGCGSGRWAAVSAPLAGKLHCIDPAERALKVARRNLSSLPNVEFHCADASSIPLPDRSQDFGYSLGVLHHIPDTEAAMRNCVRKLKPGAPFLVYLYYRFDNRPSWFRALFKVADVGRRAISRLPFNAKRGVAEVIAYTVYKPLSAAASFLEKRGYDVSSFPLSEYRNLSFYTMRTDALDRFGTRLEQRFTRDEIEAMMLRCGLTDIRFSENAPYWVACGRKA
jgi:ubiquinone/menaquinone biosynthesis C-methylase UbiE